MLDYIRFISYIVGVEGGFLNLYPTECDKLSVKIIHKRLDLRCLFLYLYCMRERLTALLIVFLMVMEKPCRMRVRAIEVEYLPTSELSYKPKK
jgi:hypothetical protein